MRSFMIDYIKYYFMNDKKKSVIYRYTPIVVDNVTFFIII